MNKLAPICLFTYNRLAETQKTIENLKNNSLSSVSDFFIFSDGPKNESCLKKVNSVRQYLKTVNGFKNIIIYEFPENKGLANSIIYGVTEIIQKYGKVIVLEDDLITSVNFLSFMNEALNFFENNSKIHSISGYTLDLPSLRAYNKDYYLGYRASSWGWATWSDRWNIVDWDVSDYDEFKYDLLSQVKFMRGGSDLPHMLKNQLKGKIDSWAIRWCYNQFKNDQLTVFPKKSKIISIGIGGNATHTKKTIRFYTELDDSQQDEFLFDNHAIVDKKLAKEFKKKFSVLARLRDKFL